MLAAVLLGACAQPIDADAAQRWARRHETTLATLELQLGRVLGRLPSLPGDTFACRELTVPPGLSEADQERLRKDLCRQREALWHADRHEAEDELGTAWLNSTIQGYGVVGVELVIAGPAGAPEGSEPAAVPEWADHRGIWQLGGEQAVAAEDGVEYGGARLGWGEVEVGLASANPAVAAPQLRPALEWRLTKPWHQATATARVILLADGTPDAAFLQSAVGVP